MSHSQKCVIAIFPLGFQGKVWTTLLHSQNLSVIWESSDVPILKTLKRLQSKASPLPDLIMIDTRLRELRPYALCRWCQIHCPAVKVVLINGAQPQVLPSERQWALQQGAAELLPGFHQKALISQASVSMRQVLVLLETPLSQSALVSALLHFQAAEPAVAASPYPPLSTRVPGSPAPAKTLTTPVEGTFKAYLDYRR